VMGYDPESKRMRVESIHKGYDFGDVQSKTGFELLRAPEVIETPEPTANELGILRSEVDPNRYIIGR
jgi:acyl CoA:acetate/3-ketoacid CoA transferase beta subunit